MEFDLVGWQLLNSKTGEIKPDILLLERKPRRVGGKWMRLYQDPMNFLARQKGIRGETIKVFLMLTSVVGYQNLLPSQKEIANRLEMKQAHISRAYRQLIEIKFLHKKEGNYYLSPFVCWRGTYKQMEIACQELSAGQFRQLVSGEK